MSQLIEKTQFEVSDSLVDEQVKILTRGQQGSESRRYFSVSFYVRKNAQKNMDH